jgi:hypothetical protein
MGSGLKYFLAILLLSLPLSAVAGDLDLRAPDKLVLGKDQKVEITLRKPAGTKLTLRANVGSLTPLWETPDGRLKAAYTPPKQKFPQVAVIAAVSENGSLLDWIVIPLYGQAQVNTKTERGASVVLKVADTEYGPKKADRKGRAEFSVVVPPGVRRGTTVATDRLGNKKEALLNLKAPSFNRLLGLCPESGDRLVLVAVEPDGKPAERIKLNVEASNGRLATPEILAPGIYRSIFTVAHNATVGDQATLSAAIEGDLASIVTCGVEIHGKPLARLVLKADPPAFTAGSGEVTVTVDLQDKEGKPSQPVPVRLSADFGKLSGKKAVSLGKQTWRLALPGEFKDRSQVKITARAKTDPVVSTEATVALKPAPVSRLELEAEDGSLYADGESTTVVSARAVDRFGNPVPGLKLTASARGKIGEFRDHRATYTAPDSAGTGRDEIKVQVEDADIQAAASITLRKVRRPLSVCPRIGYTTNLAKISSPFFAADTAIRMPFYPDLSVGLELGYYWSNSDRMSAGGEEKVKTSVWVFPILARAAYHLPIEAFDIYLGLGVGTAVVGREISSESAGRSKSGQAHFALSGTAGADVKLGPGRVAAEVGYLYAAGEDGNVKGSVGGLLLTAGYRLEF